MKKCVNCSVEFYSPTRTTYCDVCRPIMRKKSNAEKEKARREKKKDEINAKRREEYRSSSKRRETIKQSSKRYYDRCMSDPVLKEQLNERARKSQAKYRLKTTYSGNAKKALERDSYKCTKCNSSVKLSVHHIDGNGSTTDANLQNNKLDNLVTLCFSCHAREHRRQEKEGKSSVFAGVYNGKGRKGWQSKLVHHGKVYYLGTFKTEKEAFEAYQAKKKELNIL